SHQRSPGRRVEPPVHALGRKPEGAEPELERCDVPADAPARELPLAEERRAELAELAPRRHADLPGRTDPVPALEAQQRVAGLRPGDPVDGARVVPARAQGDLQ